MTDADDLARAHALVNELCGEPDEAANRAVDVLHAHSAALTWIHQNTGVRPAPESIASVLQDFAARLRTGEDDRDPVIVLGQAAVDALAAYRAAVTV